MFSPEKEREYYSWSQIWESNDKAVAVELELALYKIKINAKVSEINGLWVVRVPWVYKQLAIEVTEAYDKKILDYPHEIQDNTKWISYERFKKPSFKARASKLFVVLVFVIFLLLTVRMIYSIGMFR